ncbi:MAG: DUF429 domain-containing protein [Thermomicrobiales bacterium]
MRTLGIDLASQSSNTALCILDWGDKQVVVSELVVGVSDADILDAARRCDVVGIDAPFGWPQPFVEFIRGDPALPRSFPLWTNSYRDRLRFRRTDFATQALLGRWPLSVSSDLIAITAMRCAGLLSELGVVDRSGDGRVFEVYPAAALNAWGLPSSKYRLELEVMIQRLQCQCSWLKLSHEISSACVRSHHAFDALVSSLVARAASLDLVIHPDDDETELAKTEGWIAIPVVDSLGRLFESSTR